MALIQVQRLQAAERKLKFKAGCAKYWDQLAVEIVSMKETGHTDTRRHDKVVVRCMTCSRKLDGTTINVPNFAMTHFLLHHLRKMFVKGT
jgi:hypothetical protein